MPHPAHSSQLSTQQLLLIAAAALLVFWGLGAHNRLVALRNGIIAAWTQVDEPLQRRAAAPRRGRSVRGSRPRRPDQELLLLLLSAAICCVT